MEEYTCEIYDNDIPLQHFVIARMLFLHAHRNKVVSRYTERGLMLVTVERVERFFWSVNAFNDKSRYDRSYMTFYPGLLIGSKVGDGVDDVLDPIARTRETEMKLHNFKM